MVTCLIYSTNCVVYFVVPDDHYLDTNDVNNTLQHYLNYSEKYFTSNNRLVFLPGKHHLQTDLVIQNVSNLTLQGINPKEMDNTIIYCTRSSHVFINSSDSVDIGYLSIIECGVSKEKDLLAPLATLHIYNCSNIGLLDSLFVCLYQQCGLVVANVVGDNVFNNITSSHLLITHNMTISHSSMIVRNYHHKGHSSYKYRAIEVHFYEHYHLITVYIFHIKLSLDKAMNISSSTRKGSNVVFIKEMELTDITVTENVIVITIINSNTVYNLLTANMVQFEDCLFTKINGPGVILAITDIYGLAVSQFLLRRCRFTNIHVNSSAIIRTHVHKAVPNTVLVVTIHNTSFSMLEDAERVLWVENTNLILVGPVIFTKIVNHVAIIHSVNSLIDITNHITFSLNQADYCIVLEYIVLEEQTKLDIIANNFSVVFYAANDRDKYGILCLFQYGKPLMPRSTISQPQRPLQNDSIIVVLKDNIGDVVSNKRFTTSHCDWMEGSIFTQSDPFEVNKRIIRYINNSMAVKLNVPNYNTICYCTDDQHYNCSIDELGPVYPGQTYSLNVLVINDNNDKIEIYFDNNHKRACRSHSIKDQMLLIPGNCTKIEYKSILYKVGNSCNIFLSGLIINESYYFFIPHQFLDVYHVKFSSCPLGFALNKVLQICQCDPVLKSIILSAESCNIDVQTVLRPASSWITGRINTDNSYTYEVSSHCPFDYCLPYSSHLNLSNPDSQCQFNRTGLLCGRCKEGLSTVFGTSQCKKCSKYYLFLLLLFIFVGIAVIVFLFISNFTVVDGSINGLIFYANIVSINGPVFFPSYKPTKYVYILTSFLNLDLGIEVCFYDGMDDYAKMWLQLIFPIYLIFIATLLIITSRYSTRIQRLTAHRALPVLATLFLLSYTKILRTVSSVLFSYSTITSLPSKKTTLVWSVDTEIQLFGSKFIVLFIVCLVLFLILLPFNTVLIFTRTLSQLNSINRFKPLLDTYQGPYNDRFYYWTGLQLLLRAVFYGISALDRNTNMMIGILILGVMECIFGLYRPFKCKDNNYQELMIIFNLHALFTASWYTTSNSIAVNTLVGIAVIQFIILSIYQMKLCRKIRNIPLFLKLFTELKEKCNLFQLQPLPKYEHTMELKNVVPEVAFNYREFQEPLIGQDK